MNIIGKTMIGSYMWRMNNSKSDKDYFEIYLDDTTNLLKGIPQNKSKWSLSDAIDVNKNELGKVIEQLIKGNINFLWGVTSPIISKTSDTFKNLRQLAFNNVSKNTYHSVRGLAKHNYKRYVEGIENPSKKKMKIILRSLNFGINLLKYRKLIYKPVKKGTIERLLTKMDELDRAFEKSTIPEKPDEHAYRQFLYNVRKDKLMDEI